MSLRNRSRLAVTTGLAGLALVAAAGTASAAPTVTPAPGTNLLTNGSLAAPGTDGAVPTGWTAVNLDDETAPYKTTDLAQFDATGTYPPPAPAPDASGFATEAYYAAGSATGPEGYGGRQTSATFGSITQADHPQVGFSTVESFAPNPSVAAWAGSVLQVVVASEGQTLTLRYLDPWTPASGTYAGAPTDSATTRYITGPTLTKGTWTTTAARDLSADLSATFGVSAYTVSSVTFGDLEGTTSAAYPYPNETSYWSDLSLAEGSAPAPALPESPAVVELPLAGVALLGGVLLLRRRGVRRPR